MVYNHTAEGNHHGPDAELPRHRQRRLLPPRPRRPQPLRRLHGHRQHARTRVHPRDAAADHGQPAVLGHRDARRRLPLRPGLGAGARAARRRQAGRPSSTSSTRTRSSARSSSSPSRGTWARAATRWATSRSAGPSGTAATATRCAASGAATGGQAAELAYRLTGSSDLYAEGGRLPHASINFVTAHDGFTLADLVSYERKHNEANGEDNRDGDRPQRVAQLRRRGRDRRPGGPGARARQQRNLLATLLLSQGVPMLLGGDEMGRSQGGNNNAYCPGQRDQLVRLGPDR